MLVYRDRYRFGCLLWLVGRRTDRHWLFSSNDLRWRWRRLGLWLDLLGLLLLRGALRGLLFRHCLLLLFELLCFQFGDVSSGSPAPVRCSNFRGGSVHFFLLLFLFLLLLFLLDLEIPDSLHVLLVCCLAPRFLVLLLLGLLGLQLGDFLSRLSSSVGRSDLRGRPLPLEVLLPDPLQFSLSLHVFVLLDLLLFLQEFLPLLLGLLLEHLDPFQLLLLEQFLLSFDLSLPFKV